MIWGELRLYSSKYTLYLENFCHFKEIIKFFNSIKMETKIIYPHLTPGIFFLFFFFQALSYLVFPEIRSKIVIRRCVYITIPTCLLPEQFQILFKVGSTPNVGLETHDLEIKSCGLY